MSYLSGLVRKILLRSSLGSIKQIRPDTRGRLSLLGILRAIPEERRGNDWCRTYSDNSTSPDAATGPEPQLSVEPEAGSSIEFFHCVPASLLPLPMRLASIPAVCYRTSAYRAVENPVAGRLNLERLALLYQNSGFRSHARQTRILILSVPDQSLFRFLHRSGNWIEICVFL